MIYRFCRCVILTTATLPDRDPAVFMRRARPPAPSMRSLAALHSPCAPCPRSEAPPSPRPTTEVQTHDAVALSHHHSPAPPPPRPHVHAPPRRASWHPGRPPRSRSAPAPCARLPCPRSRAPPPDCTPQPHTATLIISPLLTPSISSGGARHAGTWRPLPPARAPPRRASGSLRIDAA
jgi:hypothetical protein